MSSKGKRKGKKQIKAIDSKVKRQSTQKNGREGKKNRIIIESAKF